MRINNENNLNNTIMIYFESSSQKRLLKNLQPNFLNSIYNKIIINIHKNFV